MESIIKNYDFFGLPVSALTTGSLKMWIKSSIDNKEIKTIYGYSLYSIYAIKNIPEIYSLGSKADIFLADGRPFFWLCKLFKVPVVEGISIPQFVIEVLKVANLNHYSLMLLGATKEVNKQACEMLKGIYPDIVLCEGINGYYTDDEEQNIIDSINQRSPDILLVGMSSPKKEKFVFNNANVTARLIVPCGGMIDVLAGKTKMTPNWIKKMGFAFLYRIIQEPRRLLADRFKMIFFIFFDFIPLLVVNTIQKKSSFSIPEHYFKKRLQN